MSTPEEIQADIERQRERLAATVDALGHKLDVKAQTKAKVDGVKEQARVRVAEAKDLSTTDEGRPRPEVIGGAAAVVVVLGLLIWLRRR